MILEETLLFKKAERVLESCETLDQLTVAKKYADLVLKRVGFLPDELLIRLEDKEKGL